MSHITPAYESSIHERLRVAMKSASPEDEHIYKQILEKLDTAKTAVQTEHDLSLVMAYSYTPAAQAKKGDTSRKDARKQERMLKALNAKCADLVKSYFSYCDRVRDPLDGEGVAKKQMDFLTKLNRSWLNFLTTNGYNVEYSKNMLNQKCFEMVELHMAVRENEIKKQLQKQNTDGTTEEIKDQEEASNAEVSSA